MANTRVSYVSTACLVMEALMVDMMPSSDLESRVGRGYDEALTCDERFERGHDAIRSGRSGAKP